jgi:hypothetical protein
VSQVATISIADLASGLLSALSVSELARVNVKTDGLSKLAVGIEGEACLSAISVWDNGCFDLDYLRRSDESSSSVHFEFATTQEALVALLRETRRATAPP